MGHLRTLGNLAFAKELTQLKKLDDWSRLGVFIGYANGTKAYCILDLATQRVRVACDVVFNKSRG